MSYKTPYIYTGENYTCDLGNLSCDSCTCEFMIVSDIVINSFIVSDASANQLHVDSISNYQTNNVAISATSDITLAPSRNLLVNGHILSVVSDATIDQDLRQVATPQFVSTKLSGGYIINPSGTYSNLQTSSDTIVYKNTTDTLQNKTVLYDTFTIHRNSGVDLLFNNSGVGQAQMFLDIPYNGASATGWTLPSVSHSGREIVVGRTSSDALSNKVINFSLNTATNIPNSGLTNSSMTLNGVVCALGSSDILLGANPHALTVSTGLQLNTGSTYDGSSDRTISIDSTVVTLTGTQLLSNKQVDAPTFSIKRSAGTELFWDVSATAKPVTMVVPYPGASQTGWTLPTQGTVASVTENILGATQTIAISNKTISGSSNTITNIANGSLTNSSITVNGTSISLGGSGTVIAAAGTLSGSTLASGVTASSLTSFGTSLLISGANQTALTSYYETSTAAAVLSGAWSSTIDLYFTRVGRICHLNYADNLASGGSVSGAMLGVPAGSIPAGLRPYGSCDYSVPGKNAATNTTSLSIQIGTNGSITWGNNVFGNFTGALDAAIYHTTICWML